MKRRKCIVPDPRAPEVTTETVGELATWVCDQGTNVYLWLHREQRQIIPFVCLWEPGGREGKPGKSRRNGMPEKYRGRAGVYWYPRDTADRLVRQYAESTDPLARHIRDVYGKTRLYHQGISQLHEQVRQMLMKVLDPEPDADYVRQMEEERRRLNESC